MIIYQGKKVTAKTYAKHITHDHLVKLYDKPEEYTDENYQHATQREQEEILNQISLQEDRVRKSLGVKFDTITSATNWTKKVEGKKL
jgi:hypothetical protein|tara:strand:+ start:67 stop:327 length:261 start_codon:yes stop_codon:yes gene_type:complete